jgi:hypothetical protein
MAASDKNIVISPQRGSTTLAPSIVFTGDGADPISVYVLDGAIGSLSFEGSAGQLFSVTNNLTSGSIFSVNDVSGIPSLDIDADGTVSIAAYEGNVGVGKTDPATKLDVSGTVTATSFVGPLTGNASTVTTNANLTGDVTSVGNVTAIAPGVIVNADISASAAIVDTKLATISTVGKVSNSATTAASANTASAIVARDASGNFSAGTITAALTGNASTATTLATARTINGVSFNGSANITITAATPSTLTRGTYLTGNDFNGSAATTWAVDATTTNTASKVVARDASGNFSAGTITAALSGNATTATTLATGRTIGMTGDVTWTSASFNGGGNVTGTATLANSGVTAGTYTKVTVDAKGRATGGTTLAATDIPTLTANKISDFDTQVRTSRLDQMAAPTASVSLNSQKITSLGAPTAAADATTKAYVDGILSANDAMVFKGTLGTGGTYTALPTTHNVGWTVRVITAGTYAGQVAEIGDMYISLVSRAGSGNVNSDWTVLQTNIDGAVVGPASSTDNHVALFNGTTGKLLKSAGVVLGAGTLTVNTSGVGLSGTGTFGANQGTNATITVTSNATNANTANAIVARDASGNFSAGTITAALTGNASTATTLATARTINGTSFDGSANITTANWGTARTLTFGATGKSVDGGTNVSWTLAEIGVNNSTLTLATSGIATGSQTWTSNQGSNATFTVNVPATNLAITAGTTAGPIVTSSTGTNATLPTATGTNSGVVTTGNQTFAGIKTFSSTIVGSISGNAGSATDVDDGTF